MDDGKKGFKLTEKQKTIGKKILKGLGVGAAVFGTFKLGELYFWICETRGLEIFHDRGCIKFFDPSTSEEVGIEQCAKIVKAMVAESKK